MSRYLLLILINLPFVVYGIINALVAYKLKKTSAKYFVFRILLWVIILLGLIFAEPIYNFLFTSGLTKTEPLSLFDVIQITGIIILLFISIQTSARVDELERRFTDLHQEISIRLSKKRK